MAFAALLLGVCLAGAVTVRAGAELAREGRPLLPIVLLDPKGELSQAPWTAPSLNDLASHLAKIVGQPFSVSTRQTLPAQSSPAIYLGLASDLQPLGVDQPLAPQACQIRSAPSGSLLLAGGDARGVSHAIYTFLHELGCRWYYPGDLWTMAPSKPSLNVTLEMSAAPDFPMQRRLWIAWGMRTPEIRRDFADWQRRNRIAEPYPIQVSHTWFGLDKPEGSTRPDRKAVLAAHPEWFALSKGERQKGKPCYAHPEVIARGSAYALDVFTRHPEQRMVSVSPPDGSGFCGCPLTLKQAHAAETFLFPPHRTLFGRTAQGAEVSVASEEVFHFANEVARAVGRAHPDKSVGVLAYTAYAHPPSFDLEPNVYVEITTAYRFTPLSLAEQIRAFSKKAKRLGVYAYYDVLQWAWERPGRSAAARLEKVQEELRMVHAEGVRSLSSEISNDFGPNGVGYYVIARLLWNVREDARRIEEELMRAAFGPAAEAVQRVYRRWEGARWGWASGEPRDMLRATCEDLQRAADQVKDQPVFRDRVDRLRMYAHFLNLYLPLRVGRAERDVAGWTERYGEEKARRRLIAWATWTRRLTNTHMVHSMPFNRFLKERAALLKVETRDWETPGEIPTAHEVQEVMARDLAELSATGATLSGSPKAPPAEEPEPELPNANEDNPAR
ncbi:MAG: DUF4838 domain-containing protein [Verrucomicrobiae bacterium]|nr:DUF4838 domain-containing protein [Verrucomicrobiae bacterium]